MEQIKKILVNYFSCSGRAKARVLEGKLLNGSPSADELAASVTGLGLRGEGNDRRWKPARECGFVIPG